MLKYSLLALILGFVLDLLIGDPRWLYHPVCVIGNLITVLEKAIRKIFPKSHGGELAGGFVTVVLICSVVVCHFWSFIIFIVFCRWPVLCWRYSGAISCLPPVL